MAKRRSSKKPYPDFPLFRHATGQWAKKVRGKLHYFGTDAQEALKRYQEVRDDLQAGRVPRPRSGELTVAALSNHFLTLKRQHVVAGELTARTWSDYHAACEAVVDHFGGGRLVRDLRPTDFASLKAAMSADRLGPVALGNFIQRVRTLFKFGFESGLLDTLILYGPGFKKPPRRVVRLERARQGARVIDAGAAWKLLDESDTQLRAMILLGLNCGLGQGDCSELPRSALARRGWLDFPRPKTGIGRRAPLWPETVEALDAVAKSRPDPKHPADDRLVFLTRFGRPWVRFSDRADGERGARTDSVGQELAKLANRAGVKVPGGFYVFRRVFRTVADGARDQVAAGLIMGHLDDSMAGAYRETIADERLQAVVDHVRTWLLTGRPAKPANPA